MSASRLSRAQTQRPILAGRDETGGGSGREKDKDKQDGWRGAAAGSKEQRLSVEMAEEVVKGNACNMKKRAAWDQAGARLHA